MKISFIIPAHNAARTIERTVSSIKRLNLKSEILIIENGSTDNTLKIVEDFADRDRSVRVLTSKTGVSKARNRGIEEATGNWIVFVDADDECLNGVKNNLEQIQRSQNDMKNDPDSLDVIIGSYLKDSDPIIHDYRLLNTEIDVSDEVVAWLISRPTLRMQAWAKIYRTEFLLDNKLLFNENLSYSEDSEFFIRVLLKAKKILISDIPVYQYHSGTVSTMRGFVEGRTEEYIKALEEAEVDVEDENEEVKRAFIDYVIAHINIIGVHDVFACEIKETWRNRCRKMSDLMQKSLIERTVKDLGLSWNLQTLPVMLCKQHLTPLGGVIYYIRSIQNKRRYQKVCIEKE